MSNSKRSSLSYTASRPSIQPPSEKLSRNCSRGNETGRTSAVTSLEPAPQQPVLGENAQLSPARKLLPAVAGARVVLTSNAVVVPVETIRVKTRTPVLEEEELSRPLRREVSAILVTGERAGRQREKQQGGKGDCGTDRCRQSNRRTHRSPCRLTSQRTSIVPNGEDSGTENHGAASRHIDRRAPASDLIWMRSNRAQQEEDRKGKSHHDERPEPDSSVRTDQVVVPRIPPRRRVAVIRVGEGIPSVWFSWHE
jgi:hypothetical protein